MLLTSIKHGCEVLIIRLEKPLYRSIYGVL